MNSKLHSSYRSWCQVIYFIIFIWGGLFLSTTTSAAQEDNEYQCDNGAVLKDSKLCKLVRYFNNGIKPIDARIQNAMNLKSGEEARSIALIVTVALYGKNHSYDVPAANEDGIKLLNFFRDDQKFDEVIWLADGEATHDNIEYFLKNYIWNETKNYGRKTRIVFAYSGHGINGEDGSTPALVLANAEDESNPAGLYRLSDLNNDLSELAAKSFHLLALINACHGGLIFKAGEGRNQFVEDQPGWWIVTAAQKSNLSYAFPSVGSGSVFFEYFLQLFSGKPEFDRYQDVVKSTVTGSVIQVGGVLDLGEIVRFLTKSMQDLRHTPDGQGKDIAPPWSGAIVPATGPSESQGAFFFLTKYKFPTEGEKPSTPIVISTKPVSGVPDHPEYEVFKSPEAYAIKGIDASHFSKNVQWNDVRDKGYDFAYLKATQGKLADVSFTSNVKKAATAGILTGAYHSFDYCLPFQMQLSAFEEMVVPTVTDLPPALDVEWPYGQSQKDCLSTKTIVETNASIKHMLEGMEKISGKKPVLYVPKAWIDEANLNLDEVLTEYPLWIADYSRSSKATGGPKLKTPWTFWQHTARGNWDPKFGGDVNVFFGTRQQFETFVGGKSKNLALSVITNTTNGDCSPVITGGSTTFNCNFQK